MEYGRYWDDRDDPSGENFNYGRASVLRPLGVAGTQREEARLCREAQRQGLAPMSEPVNPGSQFPVTVYGREQGSGRRVPRSRRGEVEMTTEFTLPGFKYYLDSFGKQSRYGIKLPPPDPTGRTWYAHEPIQIHDRATGEIHERMGTHRDLTRGRSWFEISWQGKRIDLEDLFNAELPESPSQRCACKPAAKRRAPSTRRR